MSERPLAGRRVVVTRAAQQAAELTAAFTEAGAEVATLPLIEVVPAADPRPLERVARQAAGFDWLVLTSSNAVDALLPLAGEDLPGSLRTAVVGPATARALRRPGIEPTLEASTPRAEGLLQALLPSLTPGTRVLAPQAADARPVLSDGLRGAGVELTAVVAYRKRLPAAADETARDLFSSQPIGWVTFTSPRIARHFAQLFGDDWVRRRSETRALSIGPVTSRELRHQGVEPAAEARSPSPDGMVKAVVQALD